MATTQQRDATGQLVNTQLQGTPLAGGTPATVLPALTPSGAARQGATPDQAKMAGTPAQKAPVLDQAAAQSQTLAGQQRLTPTASPPSATDVAEQAAGDRLSKLGSYGTRIKALVNARLAAVSQAQVAPNVNQEALSAFLVGKPAEQQAAVTAALTNYLQGGRTEEQLAALSTAAGGPQALAGSVLGGLVQQNLSTAGQGQTGVTVGQLDLAQAGIDPTQLAQDLGITPAVLAAYSPDQLQEAVKTQVNQHLSGTDALKAEAVTASPARKAQILSELRTRGESGTSAVEQAVSSLTQRMQAAEEIDLGGGHTANVQDLLKDEGVSNLISEASNDPTRLATLATTQPGLAAWITQNHDSLKALTADIGQQVTNLQGVQNQYATAISGLSPALQTALGVATTGTTTAAQLRTAQAKLAASPSYQAMQSDDALKSLFQDNPTLVAEFDRRGFSPAQISDTVAQSAAYKQDPEMLQLAGVDTSAPVLFLTPEQQQSVNHAVETLKWIGPNRGTPVFQDLKAKGLLTADTLGVLSHAPNLLTNKTFTDLVAEGGISTAGEIAVLGKQPALLDTLAAGRAKQAQLGLVAQGGVDQRHMVEILFGNPNLDTDKVVTGFREFDPALSDKSWLNTANNREAWAKKIAPLDFNHDGHITAADITGEGLAALASRVRTAMPTTQDVLANKGADPLASLTTLVNGYEHEGDLVQQHTATAKTQAATAAQAVQDAKDQAKRAQDAADIQAATDKKAKEDKAAANKAAADAKAQQDIADRAKLDADPNARLFRTGTKANNFVRKTIRNVAI